MPTPIQHLVTADDLVADPALTSFAHEWLCAQRGAFLFGAIAPDVQTVSGQTREATHFIILPLRGTQPAHQTMFATHPVLARAAGLSPAQAAFIAGYISHLALDELWIARVFGPYFGLDAKWGTFRERLLIHNVLRTWLDQRDRVRLDCSVSDALSQVEPRGWLPFVTDDHLRAWRGEIATQLRPGAPIHTVKVFAARLDVPPAEFRRVLESPDEIESRVFSHLPPECIAGFYADARAMSLRLIAEYLGGN